MTDIELEQVEAEVDLQTKEPTETKPRELISLDALMAMGDARVEVIDGEVKHMSPVGGLHHFVVSNIDFALQSYVRQRGIGFVFPDGLIYLMHSETSGLKDSYVPDVSFIRGENIPANWNIEKPFPGAPDLAVEVMSPADLAKDVQAKVQTYLAKGTQEVWVIYPDSETIYQYRQNQPDVIRSYTGSRTIDTSDLFPELELSTDTIFKLPDWVVKQQTEHEQQTPKESDSQ